MVGWHHQLDGHEFEQVPEVGDGQGSPACYSPWGCKEWDMTGSTELKGFLSSCLANILKQGSSVSRI